jgi:hypothetical protein
MAPGLDRWRGYFLQAAALWKCQILYLGVGTGKRHVLEGFM